MSASARYIITADDRTKAALNSALTGFRGLNRGVHSTLRSLNLAFGLFLGVQVKQSFSRIIKAAAEGNKEFASSVDDVRSSFRELLVPKGGMPEAISSMKELAAVLKDPSVIQAADSLTSTLIKGFASTAGFIAKTIAGLNILITSGGDEVEKLRKQIDDLDRRIAMAKARSGGRADTSALEAERQRLAARQMAAIEAPRGPDINKFASEMARLEGIGAARGSVVTHRHNVMQEFKELSAWLEGFVKDADQFDKQRKDALKDLDEAVKKSSDENVAAMQGAFDAEQEARQQLFEWRKDQEHATQMEAIASFKALWKDTFTFWMHSSQRTARSFAQALVASLLDKAILNAIDSLFSLIPSGGGKSGFWGAFGSGLAAVFGSSGGGGGGYGGGRAMGGPIDAGRMYRVHKDEWIVPRSAGTVMQAGAMQGVTLNIHNDNRGATSEFIKFLPEHDRRLADQIEGRIVTRLKRQQYNLQQ